MHPTDRLVDLWTATVRTVLVQRGAVANAREAVLRDRWVAAQRREAAAAAARSAGRPSLSRAAGGGSVPDPRRAPGEHAGLALTLAERARVADLAPDPGFAAAAENALALVQDLAGMDLWLVTAVEGDLERVVVARGVAGMPVPADAVQPWAESYCRLMVAGEAPRAAPRVREVAAYAACPATERFGIAAYIGVPLLAADGSLFGVLCGLSATEQDDGLLAALPEVERVARLLSTVLAKEVAAAERSQAAAQAYALAERDPVTGLLNRRGWHARLTSEEERRRRRGHLASVLLLRVDPGQGWPGVTPGQSDEPDGADEQAHAVDDLVARVGQVLRGICRASDAVARLGALDFGVLAVDCDAAEAARLVRRLRDVLRLEGVGVTLGLASGYRSQDLLEAWQRADDQVRDAQRAAGRDVEG